MLEIIEGKMLASPKEVEVIMNTRYVRLSRLILI